MTPDGAMPPVPAAMRPRDRAWLVAALAVVLGASFPYLSRMMNANERPRILQAVAWVDSAELAIDGPAARGIPPGVDVARSPVDGRLYPNKPPGATVPAVVAYAALRGASAVRGRPTTLRETTWVMRIAGGLLPALLLAGFLLRRFRGAAPAVVVVFLGTPMVAYSRLLFGHVLAAALLTVGVVWVADALKQPDRTARAFFGGMVAGAAVTVEYGAAFGGVALAVWVLRALRQRELRAVALSAIVGAGLPIAALALYHEAFFGGPWSTPYHHVVNGGFAATHARGVLGLSLPTGATIFEHLLSPWGGLLYWAPVCVGVVALAVARWKSLSSVARLATVTFVVLLVFNLGLSQTGGWRVGPRYLVVGMPLLVVPLSESWAAVARNRWLSVVAVGALLWSVFVNFLAGNLLPHLIPVGNPLLDQLLPLWTEGHAPYSALQPALGSAGALMAVGLVTVVLAAWTVLSVPWPNPRAMIVATAGGVVVALLACVAALSIEPAPDAEANLRALRGAWEPREGSMVAHTVLAPLNRSAGVDTP